MDFDEEEIFNGRAGQGAFCLQQNHHLGQDHCSVCLKKSNVKLSNCKLVSLLLQTKTVQTSSKNEGSAPVLLAQTLRRTFRLSGPVLVPGVSFFSCAAHLDDYLELL